MVEVLEGRREVRPLPFRLEKEDFADEAEDVLAAFGRADEFFDPVREEEDADFIVVAGGRKGEDAGDFSRLLSEGLVIGAEVAGGAQINGQEDGEFPFFPELFDVGVIHLGRDIPVDGADIVTVHVFPDFIKVHTLPLEGAMISPGQRVRDEFPRADLDLPDLAEDFAGRIGCLGLAQGTGTESKMRLMMSSEVTSSASAS